MTIPNYDWLKDLSDVQVAFLRNTYPDMWDTYMQYGYVITMYDYSQILTKIYDETFTAPIVESIELPDDRKRLLEVLLMSNKTYGDLRDIVVAVPNYHITVLTDSIQVLSEVQSNIKDTAFIALSSLDETVYNSNCTAVIIDDITFVIDTDIIDTLELFSVPYIRRSVIGWVKPYMDKDTINILKKFVERMKPCKKIR